MNDILRLFPNCGAPTINKWNDKGFPYVDRDAKGVRSRFRYSALGLVHVGVLAELSQWGVLNYPKNTTARGPGGQEMSLTQPDVFVDNYIEFGPDIDILVNLRYIPVIEQEDKRLRQVATSYHLEIVNHRELNGYSDYLISAMIRKVNGELLNIDDDFDYTNCMFSMSIISVQALIHYVYNRLGLGRFLN